MGRVDGWVPSHRSKKPYYATAQKGAFINNNSLCFKERGKTFNFYGL